jgi:pimeloyl-ACP methyl ester carboxylesterase
MQLPIPRCTQVVIHGGSDPVVPADFSRSYFEHKRANDEDVRLIEIPAADHFDLIDPRSAAWTTVETAIAELAA